MCQDRLHRIHANSEAGLVFLLPHCVRVMWRKEAVELLSALIASFTLVARRGRDVPSLVLENTQTLTSSKAGLCPILASSTLNRRSFGQPSRRNQTALLNGIAGTGRLSLVEVDAAVT